MSNKYERTARRLNKFILDKSRYTAMNVTACAAYLRSQFPEPEKIEGINQLVASVWGALNENPNSIIGFERAEALITAFIEKREAGSSLPAPRLLTDFAYRQLIKEQQ